MGIGISVLVGVLSGIIPAYRAANMDPVEAMRS
jgi:putative ABC transport system permease protein